MRLSRDLILTTVGIVFYGVSIGIAMSIFNNFLHDTYAINAQARGRLELPRELPGFLSIFLASALFFLTDKWKAAAAAIVAAVGQFLTVSAGNYYLMVLCLMIWSVGDHLYFPTKSALVLSCCSEKTQGKVLGATGGFEVLGIIIGGLITRYLVWIDAGYFVLFSVSAIANLAAGFIFSSLPITPKRPRQQVRLLLKKRYKLYYILEFLFGARKQIFLTFGPWVLIQVFHCEVKTFAILTVVGHIMAFGARPLAGYWIDKLGERLILMIDGFLLIFVCLGYAFAHQIPYANLALALALGCYLMDMTLFFIDIARTSYLAKTIEDRNNLSSCLTAGVSVNHIASMSIPFFAGSLWAAMGHEILFIGAAVLACFIVVAAAQ
ncbi:MFS transporter, partial [bacterium]|nr:MFS transporter [bacterium]